ncbi:MAG: methylenetetrahydrofolate reductase [NAD(P)H] [Nocardioides sp.]|uniref:methylenetetrahydrofolate reductase [NAD(P)H] n=1 Tax=Nocardioides sp. TaxID=35761 RepID=UPI0039E57F01
MTAGHGDRIGELVRGPDLSISFEFMPPRDQAGAEQLWQAIQELERVQPTFVSVTYGAGGTTRDTTVEITGRIARETSLRAMGHLTCVGHTRAELIDVLDAYTAVGVDNILALRGDPKEGPRAPWTSTEGGLTRACELVELVREVGDFSVGVAAFPEGHPSAESLDADARVLAAKAAAGAEFAVTQLFFRVEDYLTLVGRVHALGVDIPILPGIMPITNLGSINRMAELSGAVIPAEVLARFDGLSEPADVRRVGVSVATELCRRLLDAGAPGLHFFTLNRSRATLEIFEGLQLRPG